MRESRPYDPYVVVHGQAVVSVKGCDRRDRRLFDSFSFTPPAGACFLSSVAKVQDTSSSRASLAAFPARLCRYATGETQDKRKQWHDRAMPGYGPGTHARAAHLRRNVLAQSESIQAYLSMSGCRVQSPNPSVQ